MNNQFKQIRLKLNEIYNLIFNYKKSDKYIDMLLKDILDAWKQVTNSEYLKVNNLNILKIYTNEYNTNGIIYFLRINDNKIHSCHKNDINNINPDNTFTYDLSRLSTSIKVDIINSLETSLEDYIRLVKSKLDKNY